MVRIFVYTAICAMFVNCSAPVNSIATADVMTLGVKQDIITSNDSLQLVIKNLTNEPIRVNNPRSTSTAILTVIDEKGKEAEPLLLIHRLNAGWNDLIDVAPNDSAVVNHARPLGELFRLNNNMLYTVRLYYQGIVRHDSKKINYKRSFTDTVFIK